MSPPNDSPIDEQILDQAIAWQVRLQSGQVSEQTLAACQAWRLLDSRHERIWQELQLSEAPFQALTRYPARLTVDTLQGIEGQRQGRRQVLKLLGIGGLVLGAAGLAANSQRLRNLSADYATRTGERRQLQLADGTQLYLNTASAVRIGFTTERREVHLLQGEIFVVTGADSAHASGRRSFWVSAGQVQLRAIGTAFSVRLDNQQTRLHVSEGAVEINGEVRADAGEQYLIDAQGNQPISEQPMDSSAWTRGQLVAKRMRLADLTAELNRYRSGWLTCSEAVADLRVSGVFQLDDIDHGLDALSQALPIRVERFTRYWTRLTEA